MSKIYLFENANNDVSIVFDETTLTEEQKSRAIALESLPPKEEVEGKLAVLKANKGTNKVWWEYVDIDNELNIKDFQQEIQGIQQALAELTMMIAGGEQYEI